MFDSPAPVIGLSGEISSGESFEDFDDFFDEDFIDHLTSLALDDGWADDEQHTLPDLESIPVGPYLAAVVSSVDRARLNGYDAVRLMQAEARLASSYDAHKMATMVEVAFSPPGDPDSPVERSPSEIEYADCEIAPALTLTRRSARNQLADAVSMIDRLRPAWERFAAGDIGLQKMKEFVRQLGHLDTGVVEAALDHTLDAAAGLTTGQLRARLSRIVMELDPDGSASAMDEGLAERRVTTYPNPDFTGNLGIHSADPIAINRAMENIDRIARSLKTADDERSLDEIRADVALELLQGKCQCGTNASHGGGIHLMVDLATLAELANTPGELAGYGPVIAEIARKAALTQVDGEWTFTVVHADQVVKTGTVRRRPTASQRREIAAQYASCVFPGCRLPAYDCDLDHRHPFSQGGPTHNDNLGPLCRHHHMARHHAPWQLERLPNGDHRWTSPLGHTYIRSRAPPG